MQREKTNERDKAYNIWHRKQSTKRFMPESLAHALGMIDIDGCEYCHCCKEPLALCEFVMGNDPKIHKQCEVTKRLAIKANLPAFLIIYEHGAKATYKDESDSMYDENDIKRFWIEDLINGGGRIEKTPEQCALWLLELHCKCNCDGMRVAKQNHRQFLDSVWISE